MPANLEPDLSIHYRWGGWPTAFPFTGRSGLVVRPCRRALSPAAPVLTTVALTCAPMTVAVTMGRRAMVIHVHHEQLEPLASLSSIPSCPIPSHPVPSRPIPFHPVPSRPIPSHLVPTRPFPSVSIRHKPYHLTPFHPFPHHLRSLLLPRHIQRREVQRDAGADTGRRRRLLSLHTGLSSRVLPLWRNLLDGVSLAAGMPFLKCGDDCRLLCQWNEVH